MNFAARSKANRSPDKVKRTADHKVSELVSSGPSDPDSACDPALPQWVYWDCDNRQAAVSDRKGKARAPNQAGFCREGHLLPEPHNPVDTAAPKPICRSCPSKDAGCCRAPAAHINRFLSIVEVADILGVSTKTVRRLIARGELGFVRIGRSVRVPASALQELLR
jgi:excisionase family DNA binding protein